MPLRPGRRARAKCVYQVVRRRATVPTRLHLARGRYAQESLERSSRIAAPPRARGCYAWQAVPDERRISASPPHPRPATTAARGPVRPQGQQACYPTRAALPRCLGALVTQAGGVRPVDRSNSRSAWASRLFATGTTSGHLSGIPESSPLALAPRAHGCWGAGVRWIDPTNSRSAPHPRARGRYNLPRALQSSGKPERCPAGLCSTRARSYLRCDSQQGRCVPPVLHARAGATFARISARTPPPVSSARARGLPYSPPRPQAASGRYSASPPRSASRSTRLTLALCQRGSRCGASLCQG